MRTVRYACVALAALFLAAAVVSFFVQFEDIERTTAYLAITATGFSWLAYAILMRERSKE